MPSMGLARPEMLQKKANAKQSTFMNSNSDAKNVPEVKL